MRTKNVPAKAVTDETPQVTTTPRTRSRTVSKKQPAGANLKTVRKKVPESVQSLKERFGVEKDVQIILRRCDAEIAKTDDVKCTVSRPKRSLSVIKRLQFTRRLKRKHRPVYSKVRYAKRPEVVPKRTVTVKKQTSACGDRAFSQPCEVRNDELETTSSSSTSSDDDDDEDDGRGESKKPESHFENLMHNYAKVTNDGNVLENFHPFSFLATDNDYHYFSNKQMQPPFCRICSVCGDGFDIATFLKRNQQMVARQKVVSSKQPVMTTSYTLVLDHRKFKKLRLCSAAMPFGIVSNKYTHCTKCPMMYWRTTDLQRHYRAHLSLNFVSKICQYCFLVFRSKTSQRMHMQAKHSQHTIINNMPFDYPHERTNDSRELEQVHLRSLQDIYYFTKSDLESSGKEVPRFVVKVPRIDSRSANHQSIDSYSTYMINMKNTAAADPESTEELSESDITISCAHSYPMDEHNYASMPCNETDQGIDDSSNSGQNRHRPSFSDDFVDRNEGNFSPEHLPNISHVEEIMINESDEEEEDYCISLSPDIVMNICQHVDEPEMPGASQKDFLSRVTVQASPQKVTMVDASSLKRILSKSTNSCTYSTALQQLNHTIQNAKSGPESGIARYPRLPPLLLLKPVNQDKLIIGTVVNPREQQLGNNVVGGSISENPMFNRPKCSKCRLRFSNLQGLMNHDCEKLMPKLFCVNCGRFFYTKESLHHHQLRPCPPKIICKICNQCFANKGSLGSHMLGHTRSKCNICFKAFVNKPLLTLHLKTVHDVTLRNSDMMDDSCSLEVKKNEVTYTYNRCKYCKMVYHTALELEMHVEREHRYRPNLKTTSSISVSSTTLKGTGLKMSLPKRFGSLIVSGEKQKASETKKVVPQCGNSAETVIDLKDYSSSFSLNYNYSIVEPDVNKNSDCQLDSKTVESKLTASSLTADSKNAKVVPTTTICIPCTVTLRRLETEKQPVKAREVKKPAETDHTPQVCKTGTDETDMISCCLRQDERYYCSMCNSSFESVSVFEEHRRTDHSLVGNMKCDLCPAKFHHRNLLRKHVQAHSDDCVILCSVCFWSFSAVNNLISHFLASHSRSCNRKPRKHICKFSSKSHCHNGQKMIQHTCTFCSVSYLRNC